MTGQLTLVPMRAVQRASKSPSRGEAELQTGMRLWVRPGNFSLSPSITSWRLTISLTSISLSFFETSITLILPPAASALFLSSAANSTSSALTLAPEFYWGKEGKVFYYILFEILSYLILMIIVLQWLNFHKILRNLMKLQIQIGFETIVQKKY